MLAKIDKPFSFILFGASGDLAQLKIFPALYEMALQRRFDKPFAIVGFARTKMSDAEFREHVKTSIKKHAVKSTFSAKILDELLKNVHYVYGQYDNKKDFDALAVALQKIHNGKKVYSLA